MIFWLIYPNNIFIFDTKFAFCIKILQGVIKMVTPMVVLRTMNKNQYN